MPSIWCSEGAAPTAGLFPTCGHDHSIIIAARCSLCTDMAFSNVTPPTAEPGPGKPVESGRLGLQKELIVGLVPFRWPSALTSCHLRYCTTICLVSIEAGHILG
ncbi:hypothetical protein KOW79_007123 [Hemibagrus wyckioides]|uniref:Uncharacterized protein n=1 Tax=Hemibagrus wyckioides TaxID=337641 RepID=A0A9D3NVF5_9TELE|nr:hypothetical protein KOW79_007123 [Hemibagrus wyckioides]